MKYLNKLQELNKTCLIFKDESIIFESTKRGVQPLLDFLDTTPNREKNFVLVDKVIGRGAVILAKLIGVTEIHTPVISDDALQLALKYNFKCNYKTLVPFIENRNNTGRCPIESCVLNITDPQEGFIRIKETLEILKKQPN